MINVGELMLDPDFVRTFTVLRPSSAYDGTGVKESFYETLTLTGAVQPASPAELRMLGKGETNDEVITVYTSVAAETIIGDGVDASSDVIDVDGARYRVMRSKRWPDNGYTQTWATRIAV